jgi:putative transcriptional regulator
LGIAHDVYALGIQPQLLLEKISMNNKLKVLRAEKNWSQADLAEKLNVSRQTVNALETGKYDPSLPLAFKIAKLFGMTIEEIFQPEKEN